MASPLEQLTVLLSGLSMGSSVLPTLENVKTIICSVTSAELQDYAPKIDIDRLFLCLSTPNREQIELTCYIISRILGSLEPIQVLTRYEDLLLNGLSFEDPLVKEVALKELQIASENPAASHQLASRLELLLSCLRLVNSEETGIASKASKVLITLGKQDEAGNVLGSGPVIEEMNQIAARNDIMRYRIYDLVVAVSSSSDEKLLIFDQCGILPRLLQEVDHSDILIQLNAVELLSTLSTSACGRNYVYQHGLVNRLDRILEEADQNPLSSFLVPGIIKFFGVLCRFDTAVLNQYSGFSSKLFQLIEEADLAPLGVALETVSFVSLSVEGKRGLDQLGDKMRRCLVRMGQLLVHANTDIRLKNLRALAELFQSPGNSGDTPGDILEINKTWFGYLGHKPLDMLMNIVKQPFVELRYETLNIFLTLAPQEWAQRLMSDYPGFVEFLVDRRVEPSKECLERKFAVVRAITESESAPHIFSSYAMAQMRDHVREGPWFIRAQASVAMESGS